MRRLLLAALLAGCSEAPRQVAAPPCRPAALGESCRAGEDVAYFRRLIDHLHPFVAVLQIAGTDDDVIPLAGGRTPEGFISPPGPSRDRAWRRLSPRVELHVVPGGGHEWYPDATETIRRSFRR